MTSCSPRGTDRPDVVVVVASAAHLARSLYLVAQVRETALPVVVALTMGDVAARRGIRVDADALAVAIGCPVVALDPRRRSGVDGLLAAVGSAVVSAVAVPRRTSAAPPERPTPTTSWPRPTNGSAGSTWPSRHP